MNLFKYILILPLLALFLSCETEVMIDLKSAEPRLVIDASLGNMSPCNVRLSLTQDYWDQERPTPVSGAMVTIYDQNGNSERLTELDNSGFYTSRMMGVIGKTYTLKVEVDGNEYVATDYLPPIVPIESIRTYEIDGGGDKHFAPCISFTDPKGVDNYYYYLLSINGRYMQRTLVEDDEHSDGLLMEPILFFDKKENNDKELEVGDTVIVEMQSIGKGTYTFFDSLSSPGGAQNSNPTSNFSGDVLGLFKTYSRSHIQMVITEDDLR